MENFQKLGKKVFHVEKDTIITSEAQDIAKNNGIEICIVNHDSYEKDSNNGTNCDCEINRDLIYQVLKSMEDQGLLKEDLKTQLHPSNAIKQNKELKVVRGSTVTFEALDTGNPEDQVFYQEIINAEDGCSMNAGFITIEKCNFEWECTCEEIYHIVEGTLTVGEDGKVYTAHPGDSVFFPKGSKVTFGSPDKMKAFYTTY